MSGAATGRRRCAAIEVEQRASIPRFLLRSDVAKVRAAELTAPKIRAAG